MGILAPFIGLLSEPWVLGGALLNAWNAQSEFDRAEQTNLQLKHDTLEIHRQRQEFGVQNQIRFNQNFQRELAATTAKIDAGHVARSGRVLGELKKGENRNVLDIGQSFGRQREVTRRNLTERGLSGSVFESAAARGSARGQSEAYARNVEGFAGLRATATSTLEGERLNAFAANRGREQAAREAGHNRLMQIYLQTTGDEADFLNTIDVPFPDTNPAQGFLSFVMRPSGNPPRAGMFANL